MANLMNYFFGALSSEACLYFYVLSIVFGLSFIFVAISSFIFIVKKYDKFDMKLGFNIVLLLTNVFLVYFVNRLLYSMCSKSL